MACPNNKVNLLKINLPLNSKLVSSSDHYVPPFEFGINGRSTYDYEWVYVCACIFAFICAGKFFGIFKRKLDTN